MVINNLLANSPELGSSLLKVELLEMLLVMAKSDNFIQQLVARSFDGSSTEAEVYRRFLVNLEKDPDLMR